MADCVRMAFIGLGRWSDRLAEAAAKSSRIVIAGCHSRTEAKMAAFTNKFGGTAKAVFEDVLADDDIEAIIRSSESGLPVAIQDLL